MDREGISRGQTSFVFLHNHKSEELRAMLPSPLAKLPGLAAGPVSLGFEGLEMQSHFK